MIVVATVNAVNFVDGLDGLAAGVVGDRGGGVLRLLLPAGRPQRRSRWRSPARCSARRWPVPARASCRTTSTRPGSSWATAARCCSAWCSSASALTLTGQFAATDLTQGGGGSEASLLPTLLPIIAAAVDPGRAVRRPGAGRRTPHPARAARSSHPDKQHLHHRLLEIGHSHRRAVLIMWLWAGLIAFGTVLASLYAGRLTYRRAGRVVRGHRGAHVRGAAGARTAPPSESGPAGAPGWRPVRDFVLVFTSGPEGRDIDLERTAADMTTASPRSTAASGASVLVGAALAALVTGLGGHSHRRALADGAAAAYGALVGTAAGGRRLRPRRRFVHVVAGLVPAASLLVALLTYTLQVAGARARLRGPVPLRACSTTPSTAAGWPRPSSPATVAWMVAQIGLHRAARLPVYDLPDRTDAGAPAARSRAAGGGCTMTRLDCYCPGRDGSAEAHGLAPEPEQSRGDPWHAFGYLVSGVACLRTDRLGAGPVAGHDVPGGHRDPVRCRTRHLHDVGAVQPLGTTARRDVVDARRHRRSCESRQGNRRGRGRAEGSRLPGRATSTCRRSAAATTRSTARPEPLPRRHQADAAAGARGGPGLRLLLPRRRASARWSPAGCSSSARRPTASSATRVGRDIIGSHDFMKFVPYLFTLFFFILVNNLFATIPFIQFPTFSRAGHGLRPRRAELGRLQRGRHPQARLPRLPQAPVACPRASRARSCCCWSRWSSSPTSSSARSRWPCVSSPTCSPATCC